MNKTLKIISTTIILSILSFYFLCNTSLAAIDMNLASNLTDNTTNTTNNQDSLNNESTNSSTNNSTLANTSTNTSSATVSTLSSLPESELGLTNILNILLITVGVILILLGIAIIIKIKK